MHFDLPFFPTICICIIQAQYNTIHTVEHSTHHLFQPLCVSVPMVKCPDGGGNHMGKKQILPGDTNNWLLNIHTLSH
jgi:hypothetical protein